MHVVIYTQYRENYGEPNKPYWKNKGGDTYVLTDVTVEEGIVAGKLPAIMKQLFSLIEYSNDMSSEAVVDWELRYGEFQPNPDSWDVPIFIRREGDQFVATETVINNDFQFRDEIAVKHSKWNMLPESERNGYEVYYTLRDDSVVDEAGLIQFLKMAS